MDGSAAIERRETGDWVLIDTRRCDRPCFRPEVRDFYQLERLDAQRHHTTGPARLSIV